MPASEVLSFSSFLVVVYVNLKLQKELFSFYNFDSKIKFRLRCKAITARSNSSDGCRHLLRIGASYEPLRGALHSVSSNFWYDNTILQNRLDRRIVSILPLHKRNNMNLDWVSRGYRQFIIQPLQMLLLSSRSYSTCNSPAPCASYGVDSCLSYIYHRLIGSARSGKYFIWRQSAKKCIFISAATRYDTTVIDDFHSTHFHV